ncbi:hypothetical protein K2173_019465 [Erythroxylum novogranatense]|uniref:Alpha-ketoglutarate-dependent dioxygenase AlkB-like domain-containing protein n=1 Tax=Erythroxylum novogranatense TaxID=1862640 RepID=A0AAV8UBH0_9ROSI|nr:hypothetical protein K2173_019465 [Erythroxylum novogranatense]
MDVGIGSDGIWSARRRGDPRDPPLGIRTCGARAQHIQLIVFIKLVALGRNLGLSSGGFYQLGYRDGTRLHLKMMCLGKNWDPNTSQYGEYRPIDGSNALTIPHELHVLVEKAIKDSLALIEDVICIVNFCSASGRLGLHQDKNESQENLRQGLPVVSFSIGDSGEFLYDDQRDVGKAKKLVLDSGDIWWDFYTYISWCKFNPPKHRS